MVDWLERGTQVYENLLDQLALHTQDRVSILAIIAVTILLIVSGLFYIFGRAPRGECVLLLGTLAAGKTCLFLQLRDGSIHNGAVTSIEQNDELFVLSSEAGSNRSKRAVHVVDIPGHRRVRHILESYIDRARAIVFVVDAVNFLPTKGEVAEYLYEVLAHPVVRRHQLPILLACNKMDLGPKAHTVDFVRKRLEKEIELLRSTRNTLADVSGAQDKADLGSPGEPFTFESLSKRGLKVSTAAISATDGQIAPVAEFIRRYVPG